MVLAAAAPDRVTARTVRCSAALQLICPIPARCWLVFSSEADAALLSCGRRGPARVWSTGRCPSLAEVLVIPSLARPRLQPPFNLAWFRPPHPGERRRAASRHHARSGARCLIRWPGPPRLLAWMAWLARAPHPERSACPAGRRVHTAHTARHPASWSCWRATTRAVHPAWLWYCPHGPPAAGPKFSCRRRDPVRRRPAGRRRTGLPTRPWPIAAILGVPLMSSPRIQVRTW